MEIEKFNLDDGDFLECYWHNKPKTNSNTPIVILFHGLAGSYKSPYIQGTMNKLANNGFATVLMHFRGCSGVPNALPRSYHSGESGDASSWVKSVNLRFPNSKIFTIGYSLGGNMMLKLLGELGDNSPITASISVSAPMKLDICANKMNKGFSKFYQQFDGAYTAPIHGFNSAQDYYTKCSSKQYLNNIKTPTLIIHSKDDPFMTNAILPKDDEITEYITLEISENVGHVGFF